MSELRKPAPREVLKATQVLAGGREVQYSVRVGDITASPVDAIVRPAAFIGGGVENVYGGVEKAILNAGGEGIYNQEAIYSILQRRQVPTFGERLGDIMVTTAGDIKGVKKIIHVVCHRDDNGAVDGVAIETSVKSVLNAADQLNLTSVAFPVMGTGVSKGQGLTVERAIRATTDAMEDYFTRHPQTTIRNVEVVSYPKSGYQSGTEIKKALMETYSRTNGLLRRLRFQSPTVAQQLQIIG